MASSRLESLPAELLEEIVDLIHTNFNGDWTYGECFRAKTLAALCATSKTLRTAAMPYLYRWFDEWETPNGACRFLRTLCKNPHLRALVREIHIGETRAVDPALNTVSEEGYDTIYEPALQFLHDDGLKKYLRQAIHYGGSCQIAMALLPVIATNISVLNVRLFRGPSAPQFRFKHIFSLVFSRDRLIALQDSAYRSLTTVYLDERYGPHWYDRTGCPDNSADEILDPLLNLPNLRHIGGEGVQSSYLVDPWQPAQKRTLSNVSSLTLWGALRLPMPVLLNLVGSCRVLKQLEIQLDNILPGGAFGLDSGLPIDIRLAMEHGMFKRHRSTLKYLKLTNRVNSGEAWKKMLPVDLRDYTALETLKIDEELLVPQGKWKDQNPGKALSHNLKHLMIYSHGSFEQLPDALLAISCWRSNKLDSLALTYPFRDESVNDFNLLPFHGLLDDPSSNVCYAPYLHALSGLPQVYEWCIGCREHYDSWRMTFYWRPLQEVPISNLSELCSALGHLADAKGVEALLEMDLRSRNEWLFGETGIEEAGFEEGAFETDNQEERENGKPRIEDLREDFDERDAIATQSDGSKVDVPNSEQACMASASS